MTIGPGKCTNWRTDVHSLASSSRQVWSKLADSSRCCAKAIVKVKLDWASCPVEMADQFASDTPLVVVNWGRTMVNRCTLRAPTGPRGPVLSHHSQTLEERDDESIRPLW